MGKKQFERKNKENKPVLALFRIEKGILDINDQGVNDYFEPDNL